ncbi:hypothetical protein CBR_g17949 [Chara braunii]|uniref:Uncharacterized protein n=1 Tax=Chara braunii TaxID=69332 RepID=A0A388KW03_CHABU|nr:hypothetical protein CBR_g17949 [Chara braunii]|eukprot:GBG74239.1 hypothetical protein CBR_g17949 [Chara braunii]
MEREVSEGRKGGRGRNEEEERSEGRKGGRGRNGERERSGWESGGERSRWTDRGGWRRRMGRGRDRDGSRDMAGIGRGRGWDGSREEGGMEVGIRERMERSAWGGEVVGIGVRKGKVVGIRSGWESGGGRDESRDTGKEGDVGIGRGTGRDRSREGEGRREIYGERSRDRGGRRDARRKSGQVGMGVGIGRGRGRRDMVGIGRGRGWDGSREEGGMEVGIRERMERSGWGGEVVREGRSMEREVGIEEGGGI